MFVCCECCVLSGRGLCDGLITRPEESYRLRCVFLCDLGTSWMRSPWPTGGGCHATKNIEVKSAKKMYNYNFEQLVSLLQLISNKSLSVTIIWFSRTSCHMLNARSMNVENVYHHKGVPLFTSQIIHKLSSDSRSYLPRNVTLSSTWPASGHCSHR